MRPLYSPHLPTTAHPQGWASSCSLHEPGLWPFVTGLELALWPKLDQSSIVLKESRGASQRELQVSGVAWSVKLKTKHEVTRGSILLLHPDLEVEKAHEQKEKNGGKKKKKKDVPRKSWRESKMNYSFLPSAIAVHETLLYLFTYWNCHLLVNHTPWLNEFPYCLPSTPLPPHEHPMSF